MLFPFSGSVAPGGVAADAEDPGAGTLASAGALVDGAAALEAPFRNAGERLRPTYHHTYNENHTTD